MFADMGPAAPAHLLLFGSILVKKIYSKGCANIYSCIDFF